MILLISMCGPEQFAHAGTSFDPVASKLRALRGDPADLLVRAGGGQRRRALRALPALRALFSMTPDRQIDRQTDEHTKTKHNLVGRGKEEVRVIHPVCIRPYA